MKSILIGLTLTSWIALSPCYSQSEDSLYCLPIWQARLLVSESLKLRVADSMNASLHGRVQLLESAQIAQHHSFSNLLKLSEQKFETQKEITADFVRLADGWKEEATYYQKRYKKQRRQKGLLTAVTVGLIGLLIIK